MTNYETEKLIVTSKKAILHNFDTFLVMIFVMCIIAY